MSVLTQLSVPEEARPLKIAPEAIYTSSFLCVTLGCLVFHAIASSDLDVGSICLQKQVLTLGAEALSAMDL